MPIKDRLLTIYGDTMMAVGVWFMKRGERYATWIELEKHE